MKLRYVVGVMLMSIVLYVCGGYWRSVYYDNSIDNKQIDLGFIKTVSGMLNKYDIESISYNYNRNEILTFFVFWEQDEMSYSCDEREECNKLAFSDLINEMKKNSIDVIHAPGKRSFYQIQMYEKNKRPPDYYLYFPNGRQNSDDIDILYTGTLSIKGFPGDVKIIDNSLLLHKPHSIS